MFFNEAVLLKNVNPHSFIPAVKHKDNWFILSDNKIYKFPAQYKGELKNLKVKSILLKKSDWVVLDITGLNTRNVQNIESVPVVSECDYCSLDKDGTCPLENCCYSEETKSGCFKPIGDKK